MSGKRSSSHLLLLAGIGGHSPEDALPSLAKVSDTVSLLFIEAWIPSDSIRTFWSKNAFGGELLVVESVEKSIEAALALHGRRPLSGVIVFSETLLRPHAEIVSLLGLPGSPLEAVAIAQSKVKQRVAFARHGVSSPRFAILRGAADIPDAVESVGLPAVFKPALGAGSVGVVKVESIGDVQRSLQAAQTEQTSFSQIDREAILEEPMPLEGGPETPYANYVSVESLLVDGVAVHLAVTDRLRLRHGYIEEGSVMPSRLEMSQQQRIMDEAERAIHAIGLTHGGVHTEVAWVNGAAKIIEVNARAGGPTPWLLESSAGYDYAADIALAHLGIQGECKPLFQRSVQQRFLPIPEGNWRVVSHAPLESIYARFPAIVYISMRFKLGQEVSRKLTLHLASFMVTAPSTREVLEIALQIETALDIRLEPLG
jgi:hypothetical protein